MEDENLTLPRRLGNCCRIHWNGFFYIISPLVLLPLVFTEPLKENRTWFLILLAILWFAFDVMPQGVIAVLPIIFYPVMGILSSMEVCMSYARDSQMVFMLSCYIGITMVHSKLDRYIALRYLRTFGVDPTRVLATLMIFTFTLSVLIPDACACSLMVPITKAILQVLDEISVCKAFNEAVVLKDDEPPYPSNVANAFYIGVGYAATLGGMATLWSSESGYEFLDIYDNVLPNPHAADDIYLKYSLIALPTTIILLIFTIVYLQFLFLGLMRTEEHKVSFNAETSKSSLDTIINSESQGDTVFIAITMSLMIFYVLVLIMAKIWEHKQDKETTIYAKYSAFIMFVCILAFVCPNSCGFLNYFICKKPAEVKPSPSILPWNAIHKLMPWSHFFVYGSSLAYGVAIKRSGLPTYFADRTISEYDNIMIRQLWFMAESILLTMMGANHMVANPMILLGSKVAMLGHKDPGIYTIPVVLASSLSFLLPVSSVANCFTSSWGNLRSKDMILAGSLPTIVGYILIFTCITVAKMATKLFERKSM